MSVPVLPLGTYRHYKGNEYEVVGVGCHTETNEYFVIYKPIYEHDGQPNIWVRPYDMFVESIIIDGLTIPRFIKVD